MTNLAHATDFQLGYLHVSPSTREVKNGTWRQVLEPRIMQVLVALRSGNVMSRNDLIASCWDGRIVGNDALDRAIGKLRRLSEIDGGASFTIETIARVGYRLHCAGAAATHRPALPVPRGNLLVGIGTAAVMLAMMMSAPGSRPVR